MWIFSYSHFIVPFNLYIIRWCRTAFASPAALCAAGCTRWFGSIPVSAVPPVFPGPLCPDDFMFLFCSSSLISWFRVPLVLSFLSFRPFSIFPLLFINSKTRLLSIYLIWFIIYFIFAILSWIILIPFISDFSLSSSVWSWLYGLFVFSIFPDLFPEFILFSFPTSSSSIFIFPYSRLFRFRVTDSRFSSLFFFRIPFSVLHYDVRNLSPSFPASCPFSFPHFCLSCCRTASASPACCAINDIELIETFSARHGGPMMWLGIKILVIVKYIFLSSASSIELFSWK